MLSRRSFLLSLVAVPVALTACGSDDPTSDDAEAAAGPGPASTSGNSAASTATTGGSATGGATTGGAATASTASPISEPATLRLGYFPNITHAPALVGIERGLFAEALGPNVTIETASFNAGPEAVESLFADAIDATFIGPNPAINAFVKSNGEALRIVAGSTSGGAFLVVRPDITTPAQLDGTKLATPQLGGTQDVALRSWLKEQGFTTDTSGGGDVSIVPQENGATLDAFKVGDIDGAWLPEPWATRLIQEGGATVLVDERDLWPDGKYVTTHLIVATKYLEDHPDVVRQLIVGELAALDHISAEPTDAKDAVNDAIEKVTQKRIADAVIAAAWSNLEFTYDPVASSLEASARAATDVGLLDDVDLDGIYDLTLLNEVLKQRGLSEVKGS